MYFTVMLLSVDKRQPQEGTASFNTGIPKNFVQCSGFYFLFCMPADPNFFARDIAFIHIMPFVMPYKLTAIFLQEPY